MRGNLDRMTSEMSRMGGGGSDINRDLQRRQILASLQQNNCGAQYRSSAPQQQARSRGLLETLFGGWREESDINASPLDCLHLRRSEHSACARVTAIIFRSATRPYRDVSERTREPAGGFALRRRQRSTRIEIPGRKWTRPCPFRAAPIPNCQPLSNTAKNLIPVALAEPQAKAGPMRSGLAGIRRSSKATSS